MKGCSMPCVTPPPIDPQLAAPRAAWRGIRRRAARGAPRRLHAALPRPVDTRAKPYGSVCSTTMPADGDSTMAVLQHYEDGGFEVDEGFRDLPDHIAVELEFLYVLLFRLADASMRGDEVTLRGADTMRRRFLANISARGSARLRRPFAAARKAPSTGTSRALRALRDDGGRSRPVCVAPRAVRRRSTPRSGEVQAFENKGGDRIRRRKVEHRQRAIDDAIRGDRDHRPAFRPEHRPPSAGLNTSIIGIGALRKPSNSTMSAPARRRASSSGPGSGASRYSWSSAKRRSPTTITSRQPASRIRHESLPGWSRSSPS